MRALIPLALLLAGCGDGGESNNQQPVTVSPSGWQAEFSEGATIDGNSLTIPANGHANYITKPCDLKDKASMSLTYTFAGTAVPTSNTNAPTMISLYFQRRHDNWATDGWRWYGGTVSPIAEGQNTITMPLDGPWTSVMTMTAVDNPAEFAAAKAGANLCGFVLGGGTGLGHGISGPATITIDSFEITEAAQPALPKVSG